MAVKALHGASRCLGELAALVPSGVHLRGFGPDQGAQDLCQGVAGYELRAGGHPRQPPVAGNTLYSTVVYCTVQYSAFL